jgi:hypothetical protein
MGKLIVEINESGFRQAVISAKANDYIDLQEIMGQQSIVQSMRRKSILDAA